MLSAAPRRHIALLGDGNSVHVQRWAHEMAVRGWRLSLITARPAEAGALPAGVAQHVLPPVRRSADWLWRTGAARRAVAALRPDLLHAHYVTSYGYLGARAARASGLPLMLTAWGSDLLLTPRRHPLIARLTAWTLAQARLLTGDSADLLQAARRLCPRVRTELVHWGVERARFAPAPWAAKPGFEAVSLRSWAPNYAIGTILDALAQVRRQQPGAVLHLLGGGPQEAALRAQAARLGLDESALRWHGRQDDAGMAAVLARCKLAVTVPHSDATSVSLLESMACGLAVIASDLPANRHWLAAPPGASASASAASATNGNALVPAGDANALAAAWLALMQDEARAAAAGQANARRIALEGDRRLQMDRVDALYRALLGDETRPDAGGSHAAKPLAGVPTRNMP
ncbi:MAG: glycosyltransferase [Comamonadaceae bacterium]|nr:glycosyltransferase [Comamonadaceae bacterium]